MQVGLKRGMAKVMQSGFIKGVLSVGSGNLLAQVVQVITIPLVSRVFSDESYGEYALLLSTASLVVSFATLGLTSAIMAPKDDEKSNQVLQLAFLAEVAVSTLFVGILAILSPWIQVFSISVNYYVALVLMLFYMVIVNFSSLLYTAVNRLKKNKVLMLNPLIGALMTLLITIPLGFAGCGSVSFLIAVIVGESLKVLHMNRHVRPFDVRIKMTDIAPIIKENRRYIVFQGPANLVNGFALQAPNQLFARFFDASILGNYAMCMRLLEYPITFLASPINTVYFRTATDYVHEGRDLSTLTFKMVGTIFVCAAAPLAALIFFAEPLFVFVLGKGWEGAGWLAGVLAFPLILKFATSCVSYCRVAIDKQSYNLLFCIANVFITVASISGGYVLFGGFAPVSICYAVGLSLMSIVDLGLSFYLMGTNLRRYLLAVSAFSFFAIACFYLKMSIGL